MRRIKQDHPCEAHMKKLEKGDEKIFDLTVCLHRADCSQKFNPAAIMWWHFLHLFFLCHMASSEEGTQPNNNVPKWKGRSERTFFQLLSNKYQGIYSQLASIISPSTALAQCS